MAIDRRTTKVADIVEHVRAAIEADEYPPGSRLPSQSTLMRRFGASRRTVEQAIVALRKAGSVSNVQGQGSFVQYRTIPQFLNDIPGQCVCIPAELVAAMHRAARDLRCPVIVYGRMGSNPAPLLHTDEYHRDPNEFLLVTERELDRALLRRDLHRGEQLPGHSALAIAIEFSSIATNRIRHALDEQARSAQKIRILGVE
jgi:DNA-binding FadR family transcriptional regulator